MKLETSTLQILASFKSICPQIFIRTGSELRTVDRQEGTQILAIAKIEDEFPRDFAIYDLDSFLGVIKMFDSPEIEFGEKAMAISSGNSRVRYLYSAENLVPKAPDKSPRLADTRIEFTLSADVLSRTLTAAGLMKLPDISFRSRNGKIELVARDKSRTKDNATDEDTNEYVSELDTYDGPAFVADYLASNISKVIHTDYDVMVGIKRKDSAVLSLQNEKIHYMMTSETTTNYEGDI